MLVIITLSSLDKICHQMGFYKHVEVEAISLCSRLQLPLPSGLLPDPEICPAAAPLEPGL